MSHVVFIPGLGHQSRGVDAGHQEPRGPPFHNKSVGAGTKLDRDGSKLDRDGTKLESERAEGAFFEGCLAAASQKAGA